MFYLVAYGFTTIGAFAVVSIVRDSSGEASRTCRAGPASARRPLSSRVSSPSSCWPSRASR